MRMCMNYIPIKHHSRGTMYQGCQSLRATGGQSKCEEKETGQCATIRLLGRSGSSTSGRHSCPQLYITRTEVIYLKSIPSSNSQPAWLLSSLIGQKITLAMAAEVFESQCADTKRTRDDRNRFPPLSLSRTTTTSATNWVCKRQLPLPRARSSTVYR